LKLTNSKGKDIIYPDTQTTFNYQI